MMALSLMVLLQISTIFFTIFHLYANAMQGVDVSTPVNITQMQCLRQNGKQFAVVRVWRNVGPAGIVDANAAQTIQNAWQSGMTSVDGYIFPCFTCRQNDPKQQIRTLLNHLEKNSIHVCKLWLDIEGTRYWGKNASENVEFIQEMVDELLAKGKQIGFYSSNWEWDPITNGTEQFKQFPIWYAHWDRKANFNDFRPFGGWMYPTMKQISGGVHSNCGVNIDEDWKPW